MFLWRQQWKELEVLLSAQNRESLQLRRNSHRKTAFFPRPYIKPSLPKDAKNKRIRGRENKDTWFRIYWEVSGKKQEHWKSEVLHLFKSYRGCWQGVSANVYGHLPGVRVGDPRSCPDRAALRLCLAHVIHDSVLHLCFFTSFSLDLEFKRENMILDNVLSSMPRLLLF